MTGPRIGSLFTGYGGLDMGVQSVIGGTVEWVADIEPAACRVLAAHHPGVPNLGDVTAVEWATVPPVDVLTGGYPCQPFSLVGQRKGTDDARHLWPFVAAAVRHLQPRIVILENVTGHLSLGFGTVIGDLAGLGYDTRWGCVRASDIGAPHRRERVFIVAHPSGTGLQGSDTAPVLTGRREPTGQSAPGGHGPGGWGPYAAAVHRWERVTRPAPAPAIRGLDDRWRLSPQFTEWAMGLPEGHVTGHGLSATDALKLCGNGVVPQQAAHALRLLGVGA